MPHYVPISRSFHLSRGEAYAHADRAVCSSSVQERLEPHHIQVTVMGTILFRPSGYSAESHFDVSSRRRRSTANSHDHSLEMFTSVGYPRSFLEHQVCRLLMFVDCVDAKLQLLTAPCSADHLQSPHESMQTAFKNQAGMNVGFSEEDHVFSVVERASLVSSHIGGLHMDAEQPSSYKEGVEIIHVYVKVSDKPLDSFLPLSTEVHSYGSSLLRKIIGTSGVLEESDNVQEIVRVYGNAQIPLFLDRTSGLPSYLNGFTSSRAHVTRQIVQLVLTRCSVASVAQLRMLLAYAGAAEKAILDLESTPEQKKKIDEDAEEWDAWCALEGVEDVMHAPVISGAKILL
eukprot:ANDGO_01780.mRNA.1 hypothetical protein